jgi:hypothetical protein
MDENNLQKDATNYVCELCDVVAYKRSDFRKHLMTKKHIMLQKDANDANDAIKFANGYHCELCNFHSINSYNYKKHLNTQKHKNANIQEGYFECLFCDAKFKNQTTLKKHCKLCIGDENQELINRLIKENTELIEIIKETKQNQIVNFSHSMNNSHNTNTTNNFNLQFFLNDTCKDAMNLSDFVRSIKVSLEDLEHTGREGYVNGISNIIVNRLNKLEQPMRPLHCSDLKREVLYIKENNEWTKETEGRPMLTNAIRLIANENMKQISKWRDIHPNCTRADSKNNDLYLKIVSNSMNGLTEEESDKNIHKIINNVAKKVIIDKE